MNFIFNVLYVARILEIDNICCEQIAALGLSDTTRIAKPSKQAASVAVRKHTRTKKYLCY
jgi:hypothetical protein